MLFKFLTDRLGNLLVGFYLLSVLVWPEYIKYYINLDLPGLIPNRLLLILILPFVIFRLFKKHRLILASSQTSYVLVLTATLFILFLVSATISPYESASAIKSFFFLENSLIFFLVMTLYYDQGTKKYYKVIVLLSISLAVLVGLIELFRAESPLVDYMWSSTDLIDEKILGQKRDGVHRLSSVFYNPLSYAIHLLVFHSVLLYLYPFFGKFGKLLMAANLAAIPVLVYWTDSRVAICMWAILASYFLYVYLRKKSLFVFALFLVLFTLILMILLFFNWEAINTLFESKFLDGAAKVRSVNDRVEQVFVVINMIPELPFFGFGFGTANELVYPLAAIDNLYFSILIETGFLGLILLIALFLLFFREAILLYRYKVSKNLAVAVLTVFAFFLISSSLEIIAVLFLLLVMMNEEKRCVRFFTTV